MWQWLILLAVFYIGYRTARRRRNKKLSKHVPPREPATG